MLCFDINYNSVLGYYRNPTLYAVGSYAMPQWPGFWDNLGQLYSIYL